MLYLEHIDFSGKSGIVFKDKQGRALSLGSAFGKIFNRLYNYFMDFELLILRISSYIPIHSFRWLMFRLAGVKIGKKAHLHMGTQFFDPRRVEIGDGTIVGQNAFLD